VQGLRQGTVHETVAQKSRREIPPKSFPLYGDIFARTRRAREESGNSSNSEAQHVSGSQLFSSLEQFPSDENAAPGSEAGEPNEPEETRSISFDKLFSNLAKLIPEIFWGTITSVLGREGQQPSPKTKAIMEESWGKFFEACGVEFVGEGFNVKLRNPLWLLLLPVVGTLAAVASEFGLSAMLVKPHADAQAEAKQPE